MIALNKVASQFLHEVCFTAHWSRFEASRNSICLNGLIFKVIGEISTYQCPGWQNFQCHIGRCSIRFGRGSTWAPWTSKTAAQIVACWCHCPTTSSLSRLFDLRFLAELMLKVSSNKERKIEEVFDTVKEGDSRPEPPVQGQIFEDFDRINKEGARLLQIVHARSCNLSRGMMVVLKQLGSIRE